MTFSDDVPILDVAYLARQTCADEALQRELLDLFDGQCRRLGPDIVRINDPVRRGEAAHTLLGAALAVGARRVAAIAADIEAFDIDAPLAPDLARRLDRAIGEVREAIAARREAATADREAVADDVEPGFEPHSPRRAASPKSLPSADMDRAGSRYAESHIHRHVRSVPERRGAGRLDGNGSRGQA